MITIKHISQMQSTSNHLRILNKKIALVPTMGFLHQGHLSLISKAKQNADIVIVSIFVNPAQFAPNEDFLNYPRDIDHDISLLHSANVDYLFIPDIDEIYPEGFSTNIHIRGITELFEGKSRPHHFDGVALIVTKLFNITKPNITVFGQKDYQQCLLIKKLIKELNYDIEIIIAPIVREPNGLAMSSRNSYLSTELRNSAGVINKSIENTVYLINQGIRNRHKLKAALEGYLKQQPEIIIDYAEIVNAETLQTPHSFSKGEEVAILVAAFAGSTRLIDNALVTIP